MKPFWRNITKNISIDGMSVVAIMVIIVFAITISGFYVQKEITIIDNQNITKTTMVYLSNIHIVYIEAFLLSGSSILIIRRLSKPNSCILLIIVNYFKVEIKSKIN